MKEYILYTDAGHGWLEVDEDELTLFAIADKVSSYSYKQGGLVYLEEDCDAGLFISALENKGLSFSYRTINVNGDSVIRTFERY